MTDFTDLLASAEAAVTAALGPAPEPVGVPHALRTADNLAGRIDHTLLKPDATADAVGTLCEEAVEHGFASVCVNTRWVPLASERLAGSDVMVCTVAGFPLGAMTPRAKAEEARKRAEAALSEKLTAEEHATVTAALERSLAQLRVKRRRQK